MNIEDIKKVGVVGAGTMGAGAAQIFAQFGYTVILYNRSQEGMQRAVERLQSKVAVNPTPIERGTDATRPEIYTTHDLTELAQVDLISESIAENLEVKQDIFRKLDEICDANTILTTNTSGLSISQIATAVSHPERFAGVHFFNPPEIVPAVEVIKGAETSDATCGNPNRSAETDAKTTDSGAERCPPDLSPAASSLPLCAKHYILSKKESHHLLTSMQ